MRRKEIERDLDCLRSLRADTKDRFALILLADTIEDLQSEIADLHPPLAPDGRERKLRKH